MPDIYTASNSFLDEIHCRAENFMSLIGIEIANNNGNFDAQENLRYLYNGLCSVRDVAEQLAKWTKQQIVEEN